MISRQETLDLSREFGLNPNVVEKDYVLGWLLAGIFNHPTLRSSWVFKGGTCLKKCYFETYRFSEDLDFTVTDAAHLKRDFLAPVFSEVGEWVYGNSGIELPVDVQRFDVYENPRRQISVQGRVGYRGPMQRGGDLARVKLDLTNDEILVLEPVQRSAILSNGQDRGGGSYSRFVHPAIPGRVDPCRSDQRATARPLGESQACPASKAKPTTAASLVRVKT